MITNSMTGMTRRDIIQARLRELEAELARYANWPEDAEFPHGTVIRFVKKYTVAYNRARGERVEREYTYVALKAGPDKWYLSIGKPNYPMHKNITPECTYDSLLDFAQDAVRVEIALMWGSLKQAAQADYTHLDSDELHHLQELLNEAMESVARTREAAASDADEQPDPEDENNAVAADERDGADTGARVTSTPHLVRPAPTTEYMQ